MIMKIYVETEKPKIKIDTSEPEIKTVRDLLLFLELVRKRQVKRIWRIKNSSYRYRERQIRLQNRKPIKVIFNRNCVLNFD